MRAQEDNRSKITIEIMKKPQYSTGITLEVLYNEIFNHPNYHPIFSSANITKEDQWKDSTRRLLQERSTDMLNSKGKHIDFVHLARGKYTYYGNPNENVMERLGIIEEYKDFQKLLDRMAMNNKIIEDREEKRTTAVSRPGQRKFREFLIKEFNECPIRQIDFKQLLIASHIIDYADCEKFVDKVNPDNGILLTSDIDRLFDDKFISFSHEDGRILIKKDIDEELLKKLHIDNNYRLPMHFLNEDRSMYLKLRNQKYGF